MEIRPAEISEAAELAKLWSDGWQDAHANIVPEDLAQLRTLEDFGERMLSGIENVRTTGPIGEPLGFYIANGDELNQIYIRSDVRGTGVAKYLIEDAERRIAASGYEIAWLACGIGNMRAARFYQKCGWHLERIFTYEAVTPKGIFPLDVWRYKKQLTFFE